MPRTPPLPNRFRPSKSDRRATVVNALGVNGCRCEVQIRNGERGHTSTRHKQGQAQGNGGRRARCQSERTQHDCSLPPNP
eukprot:2979878-Prymnesium_polylepis.1